MVAPSSTPIGEKTVCDISLLFIILWLFYPFNINTMPWKSGYCYLYYNAHSLGFFVAKYFVIHLFHIIDGVLGIKPSWNSDLFGTVYPFNQRNVSIITFKNYFISNLGWHFFRQVEAVHWAGLWIYPWWQMFFCLTPEIQCWRDTLVNPCYLAQIRGPGFRADLQIYLLKCSKWDSMSWKC